MGLKKHLSGDALIKSVRDRVLLEKYPVLMNPVYSWKDCIMSGLAVFGFKMPSLLQFEKVKSSEFSIRNNLRSLYGVEQAPSDTCLRECLDQISPRQLRRPFKKIFSLLQRGKMLEKYRYVDGHYIISIDGTGQYSSKKVSCENCCEKHHRNGCIKYYHQMLGAVRLFL